MTTYMPMVGPQATILHSTIAINQQGLDRDLTDTEKQLKLAHDSYEISVTEKKSKHIELSSITRLDFYNFSSKQCCDFIIKK